MPINLLAENYRFKFAERRCELPKPLTAEPKPVISILVVGSGHPPQTSRSVHFTPAPFEVVPRNAEIFDIRGATFDYNERVYERQQFILQEAAKRCGPRPPRAAPKALSSQRSPRLCERPPQKISTPGITLPSKQTRRVRKRSAPQARHDALNDTLTISRVVLPDYRRQKSADALPTPRQARGAPGRYRSPPPKAQRYADGRMGRPAVDVLRLPDGTEL
jgi:hypothetical protein